MAQYEELAKLVNGVKGTLIQKAPLEWAFHRDPRDSGLASGRAYKEAHLDYWNKHRNDYNVDTRKDYPLLNGAMLRTDDYIQAQGIRFSASEN